MANPSIEKILKLLKCPKCLKYITPPSAICENGHIICQQCNDFQCRVCSTQRFPNKHNLLFDFFLKEATYPCCNKDEGCDVVLKYNEIATHEPECQYQLVDCMFKSVGCQKKVILKKKKEHEKSCVYGTCCKVMRIENDVVEDKCHWRGFKNDLLAHVKKKHACLMTITESTSNSITFPWTIFLDKNSVIVELIKFEQFDVFFYFHTKVTKDMKVYLAVQHIFKHKETCNTSGEFTYSVEFNNNFRKLQFEDTVVPMCTKEDVFQSSNCFEMDIGILKKNFSVEDSLDCSIMIIKTPDDVENEEET